MTQEEEGKQFVAGFVKVYTQAFAKDLETLKEEIDTTGADVQLIASNIQLGTVTYSQAEQELFSKG
jgi:chorismate synthase